MEINSTTRQWLTCDMMRMNQTDLIVAVLLAGQRLLDRWSHRHLHQSDGSDQLCQLRGLQGCLVVISLQGLVQGHMALHDLCSHRYSCYSYVDSLFMPRISNGNVREFFLMFPSGEERERREEELSIINMWTQKHDTDTDKMQSSSVIG